MNIGTVSRQLVEPDTNLCQVITVTTAGTVVRGGMIQSEGGWRFKGHPDNTGDVWFMYHGASKTANGFPLSANAEVYVPVLGLWDIDFDADVDGEKICIVKA